jgi:hypothetical protein
MLQSMEAPRGTMGMRATRRHRCGVAVGRSSASTYSTSQPLREPDSSLEEKMCTWQQQLIAVVSKRASFWCQWRSSICVA